MINQHQMEAIILRFIINDKGEIVDEMSATRCAIRECTKDGELLNEIWGFVRQDHNDVL